MANVVPLNMIFIADHYFHMRCALSCPNDVPLGIVAPVAPQHVLKQQRRFELHAFRTQASLYRHLFKFKTAYVTCAVGLT